MPKVVTAAPKARPDMPASAAALQLDEMATHAGEAARLLRALANPHRLMVLCVLSQGECSVGELNTHLPLSQSALSQHLAVLRTDGLVATRRESQTVYYSVPDGIALDLIRVLHDRYCGAPAVGSGKTKKRRTS